MTIHRKLTLHRFLLGAVLVPALSILLNGCGTMGDRPETPAPSIPGSPGVSPPTAYLPTLGPAASLYHQAGDEMSAGNYPKAEQLLERALRIEPNNSYYWHMLAQVKYWQQQYPQVIQLCLKSKSIAGDDDRLLHMNDQLIAKAQSRLR